ncbi:MAG: GNAT family protein [Pseudomonas sp.]|uniref:GNAT family N-acetyltransferase n=1 Tax=Pseudomonas abieticivorans TaxID=2931382 RepID=UPI0020BDA6F4|nr:GNAT family protein [Pseudomonas sp. PIA16]MDE1168834.1 GNAT family protein [Pseudomonas sp.]
MTTELHWKPAVHPVAKTLEGRYMRLEKLDPRRHGADLWEVLQGELRDQKLWDYLPYGPFTEREPFDIWLDTYAISNDPMGFCVIDKDTGQAQGILSLMSIVPEHGRIEIGHVAFSAAMQRTPKGTEAIYLLGKLAFDQGYRRLEWKCNNDNARSKSAALRFGFSFEGIFRQHMVVKGKNRDTAWYSITDQEWPAIAQAFEAWLAEDNQAPSGQVKTLAELRQA